MSADRIGCVGKRQLKWEGSCLIASLACGSGDLLGCFATALRKLCVAIIRLTSARVLADSYHRSHTRALVVATDRCGFGCRSGSLRRCLQECYEVPYRKRKVVSLIQTDLKLQISLIFEAVKVTRFRFSLRNLIKNLFSPWGKKGRSAGSCDEPVNPSGMALGSAGCGYTRCTGCLCGGNPRSLPDAARPHVVLACSPRLFFRILRPQLRCKA